jgi:NADPH:quinone reductase
VQIIEARQFGGPEVLAPVEAPEPVAGDGEAVIDVVVAPTLFVETQIRRGWGRDWFPVEPPYVPGAGVAGYVRAVGDGVDPAWVGRRVVADTRAGGYAERVAVPADALITVPGGLGLDAAAAVLHDGRTALELVEVVGIRPGQWVLVTAAAGGLGCLLVQLAHGAGARVIGAARGKQKLDLAVELGAELAVDYSEPDWPLLVLDATGGAGVDVVFEGAGGEIGGAAFEVTAPGGRFSAHGAPSGGFVAVDRSEAKRRGITMFGIDDVRLGPGEAKRASERAVSAVASGRIRPVIGQTFPLVKAADAHAAIEAREVIGKTLLVTDRNDGSAAVFTDVERRYLGSRRLGRLATIGPDGAPQNLPVAYWVNTADETIDIGGPALRESQKFRNIKADPRVSFVVDDIATPEDSVGPGGQRGRGLEIRGRAETLVVEQPLMQGFTNDVIRIHPRRIVAWNLDGPGPNTRDAATRP